MQHYKETKFVMYVDDFLSTESLLSLQKTMTEITEYSIAKDDDGNVFGFRYFFSKFDPSLIKAIKEFFFPTRDLVPVSVSSKKTSDLYFILIITKVMLLIFFSM
jgi:hypothetical protein